MATLVALTARPSDDFFAEMLLKALGARFGDGGTTAAGAAVVSRFLAGLHLTPTVADGSGLSRRDRTTPDRRRDAAARPQPRRHRVAAGHRRWRCARRSRSPARAARSTLRMHHTAAAGRCVAKTGTLSDASDLAGWCDGTFAFAFLMNHVDVTAAQHAQDTMTIALGQAQRVASSASSGPPRRAR